MIIWKSSLLIIGLCVLVLSSMTAVAENDNQGDVFHWNGYDWNNWGWNVQDRPNIDISDVSYIAGDRLTISLTVQGSINSVNSYYHVWFNTSDAWYHMLYYPNEEIEPIVTALPIDFSDWSIDDIMAYTEPESESSVSGNTITSTIDWVTDDHTMTGYYGWAQEWNEEGDQFVEYWMDFAPDDFAWYGDYDDYYGGDGDGDGDSDGDGDGDSGAPPTPKTPGFETLAVIAALGVALIILRRRK